MTAVGQPPAEPRRQAQPAAKDLGADSALIHSEAQPLRMAVERLALTRRAHRIMRQHFVRTAVRVSVLLAGDVGALLLLRSLLRGFRDVGWLGGGTSELTSRILPQGAVPLIQLIPAVL